MAQDDVPPHHPAGGSSERIQEVLPYSTMESVDASRTGAFNLSFDACIYIYIVYTHSCLYVCICTYMYFFN